MRRALAWGLALAALGAAHAGLGRALTAHDPLADLIRGQTGVLPVLLLFYAARFLLFLGVPGVAAWKLARLGLRRAGSDLSGSDLAGPDLSGPGPDGARIRR